MKQVEKTTGRKFNQGPECPVELFYLWEWFAELYQFEPLSFQEIKAWSDLTGKNIRSWEAVLISNVSKFV